MATEKPSLALTPEALATLRLARSRGVGMATYRRLLARCGSALEGIAQWSFLTQGKRELVTEDSILRELEMLNNLGGQVLVWGAENYPAALAELPDAPLVLSALGNADVLHTRQVAVVGNRSASAHGMRWGADLCRDLAREVTVTSGLARGIDTAAHRGALAAEGGQTLAVVAGGVDHVYPPENVALRSQIIEGGQGCVVSEQPLKSAPTAQLFPRRNRIIAGLSVGVLVTEASRHSGSMSTATYALEYGREVWAVPGTPGDPRASGPNHLLKQGAQLVEEADDVLRMLPARPAPYVAAVKQTVPQPELFSVIDRIDAQPAVEPPAPLTPRQMIWALLSKTGVDNDELLRRSEMDYITLQSALTELELDGLAGRDMLGGWVRL